METQQHIHIVRYKTFIIIWLILLALTATTVYVSGLNLGIISVGVALLIASVKAFFVLSYFMHLKYDDRMLALYVGIVFLVFLSFIVFTFLDYANR
jgi:cytochrome c oxidase subunit 4